MIDDLIIGGGYAGITIGALLAKKKRKVLILEGHSLPGGCASFYKRKDFHFDVGATTLSGLGENYPLWNLCKTLGIKPNAEKLEIPMKLTLSNGFQLKRYSNHERWIKEL